MPDLPERRIADVDRDRVSLRLRTAYAEGRITEVELEERLHTVYGAMTEPELAAVVVDLPEPTVRESSLPVAAKVSSGVASLLPFFGPAIICTVIYLMTNPGGYFWPMWVWFGCGVPVLWSLLGRGYVDHDRVAD